MQPAGSADIPLFSSLSPEEQEALLSCLTPVELGAGSMLFFEGDSGDGLYIVTSGEVEILKAMGTPEEYQLAIHGRGDFFGEVALLDTRGRRSAGARARTPTTLLVMTADRFHRLMEIHPALALQMTRTISSRMRAASDATIRDLEAKNRTLAQAYRDLQAAHEQILEKEKLEKELDIARQIQLSMLPEVLPQAAGYSFGAHMMAARRLGGDFYDFFPLDENHVAVAVGDVSDKGVPAALYMALTRSLLRAEALRMNTPAETLRQVNTLLQSMSTSGQFVTVLYGVLDTRSGRFGYARAGHELPILLRHDGSLVPIASATGQVLGVLDEVRVDELTLDLRPGDRLLLFSDGAIDAVDPGNQRMGRERLIREMQNCPGCTAQAACDSILSAILAYQDSAPQFDDVTLLIVQREADYS
jgi:serine phosphatase RsbU (regulator of sigma subunit)